MAGVMPRVIAFVIDSIIVTVLAISAEHVLGRLLPAETASSTTGAPIGAGYLARSGLSLGINAAYFLVLWHVRQRTIGMRVMHLRVVGVDGQRLSYRQGAIRWLVISLDTFAAIGLDAVRGYDPFTVNLLSLVWIVVLLFSTARSATRQGLHDRAACSVVEYW